MNRLKNQLSKITEGKVELQFFQDWRSDAAHVFRNDPVTSQVVEGTN